MGKISNYLLLLGLFVLAYAIFSNYHGEKGIALKFIHSKALFAGGNTLLLLSLISSVRNLCKK